MSIAEYSSLWLPVVAVVLAVVIGIVAFFDIRYGRHFRALARVLLHDADKSNGQRVALLERLDHMLSRLWDHPEYADTPGDSSRNDDHASLAEIESYEP